MSGFDVLHGALSIFLIFLIYFFNVLEASAVAMLYQRLRRQDVKQLQYDAA